MSPEERLKQLQAEARTLRAKKSADFTDTDVARVDAIVAEINSVEKIVAAKDATTKALSAPGVTAVAHTHDGSEYDAPGSASPFAGLRAAAKSGQPAGALALVNEARVGKFAGKAIDAFKAAAPTIGGPGSAVSKSLVPNGGITAAFDGTIVESPKGNPSLLNALDRIPVGSASGTFLQQSTRVLQAATVAMEAQKPTSTVELVEKEWLIATVATLLPPIPKQRISDYAGLTDFVSAELAYALERALTDMVLNGGTAENGTAFEGILTTTGVGATTYVTSPVATIRRAIRELQVLGVIPTHITLHPAAWEEIELSLPQANWAQAGTPIDAAPARLFGLPVVLEPELDEAEAIIGDLATVSMLYRESLDIRWIEAGADGEGATTTNLFGRNLVQFRGELRAGVLLAQPAALRVAALQA